MSIPEKVEAWLVCWLHAWFGWVFVLVLVGRIYSWRMGLVLEATELVKSGTFVGSVDESDVL